VGGLGGKIDWSPLTKQTQERTRALSKYREELAQLEAVISAKRIMKYGKKTAVVLTNSQHPSAQELKDQFSTPLLPAPSSENKKVKDISIIFDGSEKYDSSGCSAGEYKYSGSATIHFPEGDCIWQQYQHIERFAGTGEGEAISAAEVKTIAASTRTIAELMQLQLERNLLCQALILATTTQHEDRWTINGKELGAIAEDVGLYGKKITEKEQELITQIPKEAK
jgi:hypothetical protein